jgi:acyl dehydratase
MDEPMKISSDTRSLQSIGLGVEIEPEDVPLTTTLIVAGAIASRDFYPGHHDAELAKSLGMRDVFMNIHTTNGLITRYVTNWAGPQALVRRIKLRLGVPNYPGDTLRLRGTVDRVENDQVTVSITASNDLGDHCIAEVTVQFPQQSTTTEAR